MKCERCGKEKVHYEPKYSICGSCYRKLSKFQKRQLVIARYEKRMVVTE